MRFCVVGTGRCGTTWIADVLTAGGIRCGHEDLWRPDRYYDRWWSWGSEAEEIKYEGDASLYALPYLEAQRTSASNDQHFDGLIIHLVREPLACISSLAGWRLPSWPNRQGIGGEFVNKNCRFEFTGDQIRDAANYWVEWNDRCDQVADLQVQVENINAERLSELMNIAGHGLSADRAQAAISEYADWDYSAAPVRPDMKTLGLSWYDIPNGGEVRAAAEQYGYGGE